MMNYEEALAWLHRTYRFGSKPGLRRIEALLERMGNPQRGLRYVHVAGTNGKGSTCAMLESVLRAAGYRTGLFVSPYLEDFREKLQCNRRMIPKEALAQLVSELRETVETMLDEGGEQPSIFEMATALGFRYFAEEGCDIVVLEVGLGGRLDSTNVIEGCEAAVLCSISLDHTEYLGNSIEQIAREKCGILKRGCVAVSYPSQPPEAMTVIRRCCAEQGVSLRIPDENAFAFAHADLDGSAFSYRGREYRIALAGVHQTQNALTVLETVEALRERGYNISPEAEAEGLSQARWAGRLDIVRTKPLCILDGAHNIDGMSALAAAVDSLLEGRRLIVIMAMLRKKSYQTCVPLIAARCDVLIATEVTSMPGSLSAVELGTLAQGTIDNAGRGACVLCRPEPSEAALEALRLAGPSDVVLACGSLYMIGEIRKLLQG